MLWSFQHNRVDTFLFTLATDPADVVVGMRQSSVTVTEGDVGSVCAELQTLPVGGTEHEISITINATDLSAG